MKIEPRICFHVEYVGIKEFLHSDYLMAKRHWRLTLIKETEYEFDWYMPLGLGKEPPVEEDVLAAMAYATLSEIEYDDPCGSDERREWMLENFTLDELREMAGW